MRRAHGQTDEIRATASSCTSAHVLIADACCELTPECLNVAQKLQAVPAPRSSLCSHVVQHRATTSGYMRHVFFIGDRWFDFKKKDRDHGAWSDLWGKIAQLSRNEDNTDDDTFKSTVYHRRDTGVRWPAVQRCLFEETGLELEKGKLGECS